MVSMYVYHARADEKKKLHNCARSHKLLAHVLSPVVKKKGGASGKGRGDVLAQRYIDDNDMRGWLIGSTWYKSALTPKQKGTFKGKPRINLAIQNLNLGTDTNRMARYLGNEGGVWVLNENAMVNPFHDQANMHMELKTAEV
jgi:hypothetical protein